jgi:hypothetical protein
MNYLLELREVARKCPNVLRRKQLQNLADDIQRLVKLLAENPVNSTMVELNAAWAQAWRVKIICQNETPPSGNGAGMKDGARLAA